MWGYPDHASRLILTVLKSTTRLSFFLFFTPPLSTFSPTDNNLISCGSSIDNRRFISDSHPNSPLLSSTETTPLTNQNPSPNCPQIYNTARIFKTPSKYAFEVKEPGTRTAILVWAKLGTLQLRSILYGLILSRL